MVILQNIFILSYYLCESFLFFDFMDNLFTRRPKFTVKKSLAIFIILSTLMYAIKSILTIPKYFSIVKFICFTIASCLLFKDKIKNKVIQSIIFFFSVLLINFFIIALTTSNTQEIKIILTHRSYLIAYVYSSELIFFVLCKSLMLMLKVKKCHISKIYINYLINAISISLVGTICLLDILDTISSSSLMLRYILIIVFCWFAINICVYLGFIRLCKFTIEKEKFSIIELKNSFIEKHIIDKHNYDKEVRKISHDMDNHLNCIAFLLKKSTPESALKYVEEIISYKRSHSIISTGNTIIDAVLNQKKSIAEDNKIFFEYNVHLNTEITIKSVDLCSFLSNALDNALENAQVIDNVSNKRITVNIHTQNGYLCMKIVNSVKEDPSSLFNNSITTKDDKSNHGLGVISMKNIIQKYSGNIHISYESGYFSVKSILKL